MSPVLVIAPHPDDEAIGCGGTLALHARAGSRIAALFMTSGELGLPRGTSASHVREREAEAAADVLGLARVEFARLPDFGLAHNGLAAVSAIRRILHEEAPELVYSPHAGDAHPDHEATHRAAVEALAAHNSGGTLLGYEVWLPIHRVDVASDITSTAGVKRRAIACYRSQVNPYRYDRAALALSRYRGITVLRQQYGEVFERHGPGDPAAPHGWAAPWR